ncbi:MAG: hypothetical protein WBA24_18665, partial [Geitlerinemataceae cyanobacterium]
TANFFTQHTLGITVAKMGLQWRTLPHSHNYSISSKNRAAYDLEKFQMAKILHHHDAMWPKFWPIFIEYMTESYPDVANWLSSLGPLKNEAPIQWRVANKILKYLRAQKQSAYQQSCRVI